MKKLVLGFFVFATFVASSRGSSPYLLQSCSPCLANQQFFFGGSGYKSNSTVEVTVTADNGAVSNFPCTLHPSRDLKAGASIICFATLSDTGNYTAEAFVVKGVNGNLVSTGAVTSFSIQ